MTTVTRGGLRPATITNLNQTSDVINFMFNPNEFTIDKSITWKAEGGAGQDLPEHVFDKGGAPTVSLTLQFDSQGDKTDVRNYTTKLWKMAMVDTSDVNSKTGKGQPPAIAFEWGRFYFKAILTKISEKFTLFDENGTPLRCEVSLSLTLFEGEGQYTTHSSSSSGSRPEPVPKSKILLQSDRLDHVAGADYRQVAEANGIDNPHNTQSGSSIRL
jgi:hypothetical protein